MQPSTAAHYVPVHDRDVRENNEESNTETTFPSQDPIQQADEAQREKSINPPKGHSVLLSWRWEALALVLAVASVVTMIVIPALYHEAPEAEWPFSININTVIALLTTLMRATMLVAVAEVIGQMKWRFFDDQQRPLSDLQRFDHASRGVLGSVKIIWFARSSIVTVVAALVMVTSVAVGPFTQQAVSTVSCSRVVPGVKASLPLSHYVPAGRGSVPRVSAGRWDVAMDMKGAMINGLAPCSKAGNGTILCPRPVRDFLVPNDQTRKDEVDVMAVSCVLYPCLRSYHAEVTRGTLVERIVSTEPAVQNMVEARSNLNDKDKSPDGSMATTYGNFTGLQIPCFVEGAEYDLNNISQVPRADMTSFNINGSDYQVPETCLYKVGGTYALALRNFLATDLLQGYCWFPSSAGGVPICQTQWWLAPLYHNLTATFDSVSDSFEKLAAAITTQFRITGTSNETFSLTGYKEAVIGSVLGTTVCTRFDWQWVLLPITLVFATAILLTVAAAQSWTDPAIPVWKTSILPMLFYNKVDSSHNEGMPTLGLDELQKVAETTKAKFQTRPSARIEGDFTE
ncbi:hypothetical protein CCHR01_09616 [Colletotrichum chrysophilum]|uniref:Uncharacterized protein n=1 Tax=Colletotrichum chrysophilum TaxID=1836956 RepID=A0AAD9ALK4_9PEZI|nr:hypothetical protein CCHR01_09616 [Colletotrichum chrysophilum]